MPAFSKTLTLLLALGLAAPLAAQEATDATGTEPAAETTEAAPEQPVSPAVAKEPAADEPYVKESFGDWQLRCVKVAEGPEPCQLYQLLDDKATGNPIMEMTLLALPKNTDTADKNVAVAGATVIVPLETLLTQKLNLTIDSGKTKRFDFTFCAEVGCVARLGLTEDDLNAFRKGNIATLTVVPVADPSRTVDVELSLSGFTAGFEAVSKENKPAE
ncbi:MAG: invasion associated locus B family protein [Albidovulum sp.]|uniref:invasion associated locus B family protein n=1 Tax=Albidovulum sp. TaxID=1872424 RepID=UPI003C8E0B8C